MDLVKELRARHSKELMLKMVDYVGDDSGRFALVMDCFFHEEMRICQRASWAVSVIAEHQPQLIYPYLEQMLKQLDDPGHNALVRNTIRVFQFIDIPEEMEGEIFERCYNFLIDPKEAIAVRAFSITVLFNIVKKIPELAPELRLAIEDMLPHGSAGLLSRGKKTLRALKKLESTLH